VEVGLSPIIEQLSGDCIVPLKIIVYLNWLAKHRQSKDLVGSPRAIQLDYVI